MPNPLLNEKALESARAGWAAPQAPSNQWPDPAPATTGPYGDGVVSPYTGAMTIQGTITATAVLFVLLLASAFAGWQAVDPPVEGHAIEFPAIAIGGVIVGFVAVIAAYFRPQWAKFLAPVYALAEGFFVGAISHSYELVQNGIVVQAAGATLATVAVMLFLYRTRIIRVTERFRRVIIGATLGVMVLYLVSFVMNLFGDGVPFLRDASALGIGFSIFVCALAAFNLMLDFDFIERGSKMGLAKDYEWMAALGLLVTIVWLYLEILRLLSKLQRN
jgi:uncharacterized YccA/Bax inhibitor family protein